MPKLASVIPENFSLEGWTLTDHALTRARQRGFNFCEIAFVLEYGHIEYRTGIRFFFFGERQVPTLHRHDIWVQRLVGTVVLVSSQESKIFTVYKNKNALRTIKKKSKKGNLRLVA